MSDHDVFDLVGEHLLAPGVDTRRTASQQLERAVGLDLRKVSGDHPACSVSVRRKGLFRLGFIFVVAEWDVSLPRDPSDGVRTGCNRAEVIVEDRGVFFEAKARAIARFGASSFLCRGPDLRTSDSTGNEDFSKCLAEQGADRIGQ